MVKHPQAHAQSIAALFGKCKLDDDETLDANGVIIEDNATPWTMQFLQDILVLELVEAISCSYGMLMTHGGPILRCTPSPARSIAGSQAARIRHRRSLGCSRRAAGRGHRCAATAR